MFTAECFSDLRKAMPRQSLAQIHSDLAWQSDRAGVALCLQFIDRHLVLGSNGPDDPIKCQSDGVFAIDDILYRLVGYCLRQWNLLERGDRDKPNKRAFKFAYVALDAAGNVDSDVVRKVDPIKVRLSF